MIILAVVASVMVESQLVTSMPTGDPILIGKPHIIRPVCIYDDHDHAGSSFSVACR